MSSLDNMLGASINTYQALKDATVLLSESEQSPGMQDLKSGQQLLLKNLVNSLQMTKGQLSQQIKEGNVSLLDPTTLDLFEKACDEMEMQGSIENKIKMLGIGVFGLDEPLGPILYELRKLLRVARSLKRGQRVEKVQRAKKSDRDEHRERK